MADSVKGSIDDLIPQRALSPLEIEEEQACGEITDSKCVRISNQVFWHGLENAKGNVQLWMTSVARGAIAIFKSQNGTMLSTRIFGQRPTIHLTELVINKSMFNGVRKILNGVKVLAYVFTLF